VTDGAGVDGRASLPPSRDEVDRRRDAALAGHVGAEGEARRFLDDPSPRVRATALGALERRGEARLDDVSVKLCDPDPMVRRRACEVAASHVDVDLVPLLADDEPSVVEAAAWALGERSEPATESVKALCAVVAGHEDSLCREAAVAALGAIGHEAGLPAILGATKDKAVIRRRAVIALAPFDGPEVETALRDALSDRDWQVRQAAEDLASSAPADDGRTSQGLDR